MLGVLGRKQIREKVQHIPNKVFNIFAYLGYLLVRGPSRIFGEFLRSSLLYFLWKAGVMDFSFEKKINVLRSLGFLKL